MGGSALQCKDCLLHCTRKVNKDEVTIVIEVIFPTLINDADKVILGCSRIGQESIDLPAH